MRLTWDDDALILHGGHERTRIEWRFLDRLACLEPWPRLAVESYSHRVWGPHDVDAPESFDAHVEKLFAFARERRPDLELEEGWLAAPVVAWESANHVPGDEPPQGSSSSFRDASRPVEAVEARWRRGRLELRTRLFAEWRELPEEIVLTTDRVYVRTEDDIRAMRRDALRVADRGTDFTRFIFGRRTMFVLPPRLGCPVTERLEADLATGDDSRARRG